MEEGATIGFFITGLCCLIVLPLFTTILLLTMTLVKRRGLGFGVFLSGVTTGILAAIGTLILRLDGNSAFRHGRLDTWELLWLILPALYAGFGVGSLLAILVGTPIDLLALSISLVTKVIRRIFR